MYDYKLSQGTIIFNRYTSITNIVCKIYTVRSGWEQHAYGYFYAEVVAILGDGGYRALNEGNRIAVTAYRYPWISYKVILYFYVSGVHLDLHAHKANDYARS